jgi:predicted enzyme related to lactoylglutathione lyase
MGQPVVHFEIVGVDGPALHSDCSQLQSLGGARVMGPETIMPGTTIGQFTDPEGHLVGVVSAG